MVLKTREMQIREWEDPQRRDIREILRSAYAQHGGIVEAAKSLGIDDSTFSKWVTDLKGEIRVQRSGEVVFPGFAAGDGEAQAVEGVA